MIFKKILQDKLTVSYIFLVLSLLLHITDEAANRFLDFYNPLVLKLKDFFPIFPFPTFSFKIWITGLVLLIVVLLILTPVIYHKNRFILLATKIFAVIMIFNGLGHIAFSIYYQSMIPGLISSPFLIFLSIYFLYQIQQYNRSSKSIKTSADSDKEVIRLSSPPTGG
jgi:hypothetical protein